MSSHSAVPKIRLAGLERAARCAGESFAYEELSGIVPARDGDVAQLRRLWWLVAALALVGFAVLALR